MAKYRTDEERVSDDVDADEESDVEELTSDRHHHSYSYYSSRDDIRIQDFSFSWIAVVTRFTPLTDSSESV